MTEISNGARDFDFFHGRWHVAGRKLRDTLDRDCTEWVEFEGIGECRPILGGLGNVDTLDVAAFPPDGRPMHGATLRMFHPATGTWSIWWMSTRAPGLLDPPVTGSWTGDRGIFEGPDEYQGKKFLVRFEWDRLGEGKALWAQRFSWDNGLTWDDLNYTMAHTRLS